MPRSAKNADDAQLKKYQEDMEKYADYRTYLSFRMNEIVTDGEGNIIQLDQARGINKALMKMIDYIEKNVKNPEEKILGITNCNCPERAEMLKEELLKRLPVKDIIICDAAGVSSMYANDGGIIIAV